MNVNVRLKLSVAQVTRLQAIKKPLKSGFFLPVILANDFASALALSKSEYPCDANAGIHFDCHSGGGQNLGKVALSYFSINPPSLTLSWLDTSLRWYDGIFSSSFRAWYRIQRLYLLARKRERAGERGNAKIWTKSGVVLISWWSF